MTQSIASRIGRGPALIAALVVALIATLVVRNRLRHHDDDAPMWSEEPPAAQVANWLRVQPSLRAFEAHRCDRPVVPGRTTGVVLDDRGLPVAGAVVRFSHDLTTTTADDGSFAITSYRDWNWDPIPTARKGDLVGIAAWTGDPERFVIHLVHESIVVHVRRIDEVAIARATVTLYDTHHAVVASRVADDRGTAAFSQIGNATTLIATAPGHADREVELPLQQQRPIELTARLYVTGGHLVEGRVLDHLGRAAAGVRVGARSDRGTVTDADGAFRLWVEEAASYTIDAFEPNGVATGEVTTAASSSTGLVVRLDPPKYPMITVDVTVVDTRGRPVPDAELYERDHGTVDRTTYAPIGFDEIHPKRTDARGHAVFQVRARGGNLAVAAHHDEGSSDLERFTLVDAAHEPLAVSAQMARTLTLKPSRVSGVVVDESGRPVEDALVQLQRKPDRDDWLHSNDTSEWTRTGSDGRFVMSPWRGRYRAVARLTGCLSGGYDQQESFETPHDGVRVVLHRTR